MMKQNADGKEAVSIRVDKRIADMIKLLKELDQFENKRYEALRISEEFTNDEAEEDRNAFDMYHSTITDYLSGYFIQYLFEQSFDVILPTGQDEATDTN